MNSVRLLFGCLSSLLISLSGLALVQPAAGNDLQFMIPVREPLDLKTHWRIPYAYQDFQGETHRFYCDISKKALSHEKTVFGLPVNQEEAWKELDRRLQREIFKESPSDLHKYFKLEVRHLPGESWKWELADREWNFQAAPKDERAKLVEAANKLELWIKKDLDGRARQVARRYYRQRGFRLEDGSPDRIEIDYNGIIRRAKQPLADCYQALLRQAGAQDATQLMTLMIAFFQDLEFKFPPQVEQGRKKAGFWPPLEVMTRKQGDCDSKGAGLCGLWRGYPTQILLIEEDLPINPEVNGDPILESYRHLLSGFEAEPQGNQAYITVGMRKFILCEVAGPARYAPGRRPYERRQRGRVDSKSFRRYLCLTEDCPGTMGHWNLF